MLQSNQKVTVHVNNEQSRNCCSSRGLSVFAVEVPARTKMVQSLPDNNVLVIITRRKFLNHVPMIKCANLLYSSIKLNSSFWISNYLYSCDGMMEWNDYSNAKMCVLFPRCANTSCPLMTDRIGLIIVWRLFYPAPEAVLQSRIWSPPLMLQKTDWHLWTPGIKKGRCIMNRKSFRSNNNTNSFITGWTKFLTVIRKGPKGTILKP